MRFKRILIFLFLVSIAPSARAQYNFEKYMADARSDLMNKKYADAIGKLSICIQVKPADYQSWFYRGLCKYFLSDYAGSLADLEQATSNYSPWFYDACTYRALAKDRLENYEGAIKDFTLVINKNSEDPQLYVQRGLSKLHAQDAAGALADCRTALGLHGLSEELFLCKGAAETELGEYEEAIKDFDHALTINPQNAYTLVRRGIAHSKAGRNSQAMDDIDAAIRIDSANTFAWYNRAALHLDMKQEASAAKDYEMLLAYEPSNALAWYNLAVVEANRSNYRKALAAFNRVLELNPENIQALLNRARVKQTLSDYAGAFDDYDKSISLFPYFTEAYYERSMLKKSLGDKSGAQKDYDKGKMMSDLNHSKKEAQVKRDSLLLTKLTGLQAEFSGGKDTLQAGLMPIYQLVLRDSVIKGIPVLLKDTRRDYSYYLLVLDPGDAAAAAPHVPAHGLSDSLLLQGVQHTSQQLYNDASASYERAIAADSGCTLAYLARGINACRQVELLDRFDEDISVPGQSKKVVKSQKDEMLAQAVSDFSKVIRKEPSFAQAWYNRAYVKYRLHDINGAVKDYEGAVAADAGLAAAWYNKGWFLLLLNAKAEACSDFSKAGELGIPEAYGVIRKYCTGSLEK